jgi:chromosome condensin MukBEF MukE localization factor
VAKFHRDTRSTWMTLDSQSAFDEIRNSLGRVFRKLRIILARGDSASARLSTNVNRTPMKSARFYLRPFKLLRSAPRSGAYN